jgi:Polyketide cyclase / dehydrase and lipid transport
MAKVDVAVSSELSPEQAWALASDLRRFDEWLTIFAGWRSVIPAQIEVGTCVSSCIRVKGFRNVVHWKVTRYDEPKVIELIGRGRPGIRIAMTLCVEKIEPGARSDVASGSVFQVVADLSGGLLSTPVGRLVAKVLDSDVRKSVSNLAALR